MTLQEVCDNVLHHVNDIAQLFKPGARITLLVRHMDDPEGTKDFIVSSDKPNEVVDMIRRRMMEGEWTPLPCMEGQKCEP